MLIPKKGAVFPKREAGKIKVIDFKGFSLAWKLLSPWQREDTNRRKEVFKMKGSKVIITGLVTTVLLVSLTVPRKAEAMNNESAALLAGAIAIS